MRVSLRSPICLSRIELEGVGQRLRQPRLTQSDQMGASVLRDRLQPAAHGTHVVLFRQVALGRVDQAHAVDDGAQQGQVVQPQTARRHDRLRPWRTPPDWQRRGIVRQHNYPYLAVRINALNRHSQKFADLKNEFPFQIQSLMQGWGEFSG